MNSIRRLSLAALVMSVCGRRHELSRRAASWPSPVFAPYVDVSQWPTPSLTEYAQTSDVLFYTLAFVVGVGGEPSWGGVTPVSDKFYLAQIRALRALGGDVCVSFGGAAGQELALGHTDAAVLAAKYQSVIDTYSLSRVDFDIEGSTLENTASVNLRNAAIAILQKSNPALFVSFTLPVSPNGLTAQGVAFLKSCANAGVRVDVLNGMTMDFGSYDAPDGDSQMGEYSITAAIAMHTQLASNGFPDAKVGITPMIGKNDVQGECFQVADAHKIAQFVNINPYVGLAAMWSMNRDNGDMASLDKSSMISQSKYQFAQILVQVNGAPSIPQRKPGVSRAVVSPPAVIPTLVKCAK